MELRSEALQFAGIRLWCITDNERHMILQAKSSILMVVSHGVRKPHQIFLTSPWGARTLLASLLVITSSRKSKRSLAAYAILACPEMTASGYPKHRNGKQSSSKTISALFSVIMVWKLPSRPTKKPSTSSMLFPSTCLMGNTWPTPNPETSHFYVNKKSNHPPRIIENIPKSINKRLPEISIYEHSFSTSL